jgi:hypothetical protein
LDGDRVPAHAVDLDVDPVRGVVRVDHRVLVQKLPPDLDAHAVVRGDVEPVDPRLLELDEAGDDGADGVRRLGRQDAPGTHRVVQVGQRRALLALLPLQLVDVVHDGEDVLDGEAGSKLLGGRLGLGRLQAREGPGRAGRRHQGRGHSQRRSDNGRETPTGHSPLLVRAVEALRVGW